MIDVRWQEGDVDVRWTAGGTEVCMTFPAPPYTVTAWDDPPSVVVVTADARVDNAVVLDPDGTERLRLVPPRTVEPNRAIGFYAVYPDPGGLVAVFSTQAGDVWGRPDLTTGELTNVSIWR